MCSAEHGVVNSQPELEKWQPDSDNKSAPGLKEEVPNLRMHPALLFFPYFLKVTIKRPLGSIYISPPYVGLYNLSHVLKYDDVLEICWTLKYKSELQKHWCAEIWHQLHAFVQKYMQEYMVVYSNICIIRHMF